jgi:hypothetical protein
MAAHRAHGARLTNPASLAGFDIASTIWLL